jgi:hypothetical protein
MPIASLTGCASSRSTVGMRNASVLPVPVFALAKQSLPANSGGREAACTGEYFARLDYGVLYWYVCHLNCGHCCVIKHLAQGSKAIGMNGPVTICKRGVITSFG